MCGDMSISWAPTGAISHVIGVLPVGLEGWGCRGGSCHIGGVQDFQYLLVHSGLKLAGERVV